MSEDTFESVGLFPKPRWRWTIGPDWNGGAIVTCCNKPPHRLARWALRVFLDIHTEILE